MQQQKVGLATREDLTISSGESISAVSYGAYIDVLHRCPRCSDSCNCRFCRKAKGLPAMGKAAKAPAAPSDAPENVSWHICYVQHMCCNLLSIGRSTRRAVRQSSHRAA